MKDLIKSKTEEYFEKEYKRSIEKQRQKRYEKNFEKATNKLNNTEETFNNIDVDSEHLENVFTKKRYYLAMKNLPLLEKKVLYYSAIECQPLNWISKKLKLTKNEVVQLLNKAKKDFKKNLLKISKGEN